jgi:hypothetical protein
VALALATIAAPTDREKQAKEATARHHLELVYRLVCDPPDIGSMTEHCVDAIRVRIDQAQGQGRDPRDRRYKLGDKEVSGEEYIQWFMDKHKDRSPVIRQALKVVSDSRELSGPPVKIARELVEKYDDLVGLINGPRVSVLTYNKRAANLQKALERLRRDMEKELQLSGR